MNSTRFIGGTATAAVVGVIAAAMPSAAATAHAEAKASTLENVKAIVSVNAANSVKTDADGDLMVRYYNNGKGKHLPRQLEKRAPFAKDWKQLEREMKNAPEGTVIKLKYGKDMPTTWKDVDDQPVATWAQVGYGNKKIKHFAFQKVKGQILNRGFFGKFDCKNPKTKKPKIDMSSVTVSESFNGIWYVIDMAVGATGTVGGQVAVTCPASSASSSFSAEGKYSGVISLTVKAKSKTEAITMASGQAETSIKTSADVRATLMASGEQSAEGTAVAKCEGNPPPPPPPPTPEVKYSCDTLAVTKGNARSVTISNLSTTQSGGATFKRVEVNWGDGSQPESFISPVGKGHTYAGDGPYTITATAVFDVNGAEKTASGTNCQTAVKFDTIINPPTLDTIVKVNDVIEYSDRTIRITGTVPAGRTAILLVNACNGGTITSNQRVEVTGSFSKDIGYRAGEVPGENTDQGCEVQAGYERLNVTLTDTVDARLKDADATSFRILVRPPTPDKSEL